MSLFIYYILLFFTCLFVCLNRVYAARAKGTSHTVHRAKGREYRKQKVIWKKQGQTHQLRKNEQYKTVTFLNKQEAI